MTDQRSPERSRHIRRLASGVLVVLVVTLGWAGIRSAGSTAPLARAERLVVVSVPGLRWQDLDAVATPHIDALIGDSALLSVRAIGTRTSLLEGYASMGAGNRLEPPRAGPIDVRDGCDAGLVADLADDAHRDLTGAEPGALGDALRGAGLTTAVYGGGEALAALMDGAGCVGTFAAASAVRFDADVTLVEWSGLQTGGTAAERFAAVQALDAAVATWQVPADAAVLLVAPMAVDEGAEVTVAAWRGAGPDGHAALQSPSTRRAGYLTLNDLAPTVLAVLGVELPDSMNGTPGERAAPVAETSQRVQELADLADRVAFRDRAITPVVLSITIGVILYIVLWWRGQIRRARSVGALTAALPTVAFLSALTDYHLLPLWVYVVLVVLAGAALAMASAGVAQATPWTSIDLLAGLLWLVLVIDLVTGGRLQINTPLGYTPTVAGRFQGLGNVAFGLLAIAALATACAPSAARDRAGSTTGPAAGRWVAGVGVVTAIVVAAPRFGSDFGGTLAVVPCFAVASAVVTGRRIGWRRIGAVALATVGLVVVLALVDRARPASQQTHLGRFAGRLLDGEAGVIVRRKLQGNIDLFTASVLPALGVALVVVGLVYAWRRRAELAELLEPRRGSRAFLAGFAVVAVLGLALNDSGIAVPAVMLSVAVPWLLAALVPVPERQVRDRPVRDQPLRDGPVHDRPVRDRPGDDRSADGQVVR